VANEKSPVKRPARLPLIKEMLRQVYALNAVGLPSDADIAAWLRERPARLLKRDGLPLDEPRTSGTPAHDKWLDGRLYAGINLLLMWNASGRNPAISEALAELRQLSTRSVEERTAGLRLWREQRPGLFQQIARAERESHQRTDYVDVGDERVAFGRRKATLRFVDGLEYELETSGFLASAEQQQAAKVRRWRHQWRAELESARPAHGEARPPDPRPGAPKRGRLPI
jgi:hypothetical protein